MKIRPLTGDPEHPYDREPDGSMESDLRHYSSMQPYNAYVAVRDDDEVPIIVYNNQVYIPAGDFNFEYHIKEHLDAINKIIDETKK